MKDAIYKIVANKFKKDVSSINGNQSFVGDLGADSMDTVELVMDFEKELGVIIPDEAVDNLQTVNDVVKYSGKG